VSDEERDQSGADESADERVEQEPGSEIPLETELEQAAEAAEPELAETPAADEIEEPADGVVAEEATSEEPDEAEEPVAEAEEPAAEAEEPAAPEPTEAPEPTAASPEPTAATEDVVVEDDTEIVEADVEEVDVTPRVKPEIPGADLIPDIVPEGEEFLDAEAQAAAEAEAEAAAAREQEDQAEAQPIADAAIDLAAGARYTATGKRKTAVARVILKPGSGTYLVNGRSLDVAFPRDTLQRVIRQPLEAVGYDSRMDVVARIHGGGVAAQSGALRHGISRALLEADPNLRGELKRRGFLTRDSRVKERKKAGLKKARKRPQFSKR
jgi:small subunit ribosomal protein S9